MNYKIIIVDDHTLVANSLTEAIENKSNFKITFCAKNGKELQSILSNKKNIPDIILLDINMPIMNGYETLQWINEHFTIPVIALSMNDDEVSIIKMIKLGAKAYILKDAEIEELINTIEKVITKGQYYSEYVSKTLVDSLSKVEKIVPEKKVFLKDKEIEFLKFVCTDKTYKEIAEMMFVSPKTIDGYRDSLLEKLEVNSRVGLVVYAIKNGYYIL